MRITIYPLVALILGLTGCASVVKPTPEAMASSGVAAYGVQRLQPNISWLRPVVDGKVLSVTGGETKYIVLEPGTHTLDAFRQELHLGNTIRYTTFPVDRKFEIKKGQVTSLGVAVLEMLPKKRFRIVWSDNQTRIRENIRAEYPQLLAGGRHIQVAEGKYLSPSDMKRYRRYVAFKRALRYGKKRSGYVGGALGTLAEYKKSSSGKVESIRLVDTKSTAELFQCRETRSGVACPLTDGETVLASDGRSVDYIHLPGGTKWRYLDSLGGDRLVLTDSRLGIALSADGGHSWVANLKYRTSEGSIRRQNKLTRGKHGVYVYSTGGEGRLLYIPDGTTQVRKIDFVPDADSIQAVLETDAGLYAGPEYTVFGDARIFFRPKGQTKWTVSTVPESSCRELRIPKPGVLQVKCGGTVLRSTDAGKTWTNNTHP